MMLIPSAAHLGAQWKYEKLNIDISDQFKLAPSLSYYRESDHAIPVDLAIRYFEAGKFTPVKNSGGEFLNNGLIPNRCWYAFSIENKSAVPKILMLESILSNANRLDVYEKDEMGRVHSIPALAPTVQNGSLLVKPLGHSIAIKSGESKLILIKADNKGQILYIPLTAFSLAKYQQQAGIKSNVLGIFQGIFLFIILFSTVIFLTTRELLYALYSIYSFFICLFVLNESGVAHQIFGNMRMLNQFSSQFSLLVGTSVWLFLLIEFLRLKGNNAPMYRAVFFLAIFTLVYAALPFLIFHKEPRWITGYIIYQRIFVVLFFVNLTVILLTILHRINKKDKLALFYGIANLPVILGSVLYYGNSYNLLDVRYGSLNPIAVGLSLETFLMSFGFIYRYLLLIRDKQNLLEEKNRQRFEIAASIIQAQESERRRIAQDLHDELGGNLAAINMAVQRVDLPIHQKDAIHNLILKTAKNARHIAHNLMPPDFEHTTELNLIATHIHTLNESQHTTRYQFQVFGMRYPYSMDAQLNIYRIVLELVQNISKHAFATEANIQVMYHDSNMEIIVEDNGQGFNAENSQNGLGLHNAKTRVRYLNGKMVVDTGPAGTTIIIQIPYHG
jgi:signal transduction histidine kinase